MENKFEGTKLKDLIITKAMREGRYVHDYFTNKLEISNRTFYKALPAGNITVNTLIKILNAADIPLDDVTFSENRLSYSTFDKKSKEVYDYRKMIELKDNHISQLRAELKYSSDTIHFLIQKIEQQDKTVSSNKGTEILTLKSKVIT